ncbi:hypothetical protein D3C75_1140910 [compost metagenome]
MEKNPNDPQGASSSAKYDETASFVLVKKNGTNANKLDYYITLKSSGGTTTYFNGIAEESVKTATIGSSTAPSPTTP